MESKETNKEKQKRIKKEVTKEKVSPFPESKKEWPSWKQGTSWVLIGAKVDNFAVKGSDVLPQQELKTQADAESLVESISHSIETNVTLLLFICSVLPMELKRQVQQLSVWERDKALANIIGSEALLSA